MGEDWFGNQNHNTLLGGIKAVFNWVSKVILRLL